MTHETRQCHDCGGPLGDSVYCHVCGAVTVDAPAPPGPAFGKLQVLAATLLLALCAVFFGLKLTQVPPPAPPTPHQATTPHLKHQSKHATHRHADITPVKG